MKKIILLLSLSFLLSACANTLESNDTLNTTTVCINEKCFTTEIADTNELRQLGLMYRDNLPVDEAMLFIFDKISQHNFWMKNTLIPLDIIWLDENKKIIYIKNNTQPCKTQTCKTFSPEQSSKYVLEIQAKLANQYNFSVGDSLIIK